MYDEHYFANLFRCAVEICPFLGCGVTGGARTSSEQLCANEGKACSSKINL